MIQHCQSPGTRCVHCVHTQHPSTRTIVSNNSGSDSSSNKSSNCSSNSKNTQQQSSNRKQQRSQKQKQSSKSGSKARKRTANTEISAPQAAAKGSSNSKAAETDQQQEQQSSKAGSTCIFFIISPFLILLILPGGMTWLDSAWPVSAWPVLVWLVAGGLWRVVCGLWLGNIPGADDRDKTTNCNSFWTHGQNTVKPQKTTVKPKRLSEATVTHDFSTLTLLFLTLARCDHQNITECFGVCGVPACCLSFSVCVVGVVCGCLWLCAWSWCVCVCAVWCVVWYAENPPCIDSKRLYV